MNSILTQLNLQTRAALIGLTIVSLTFFASLQKEHAKKLVERSPSSAAQAEMEAQPHEQREPNGAVTPTEAKATVTYKITDGYGEYTGQGPTKIMASEQARTACIMQKVTAYENRFGVAPDADTTDLFIDACINR